MSIRKKTRVTKNGQQEFSWTVDVNRGGKRYRKTFDNAEAAARYLAAIRSDDRRSLSVGEAFRVYEARPFRRPSNARSLGRLFDRHGKPTIAEIAINEVTAGHFRMLASRMKEHGAPTLLTYRMLKHLVAAASYGEKQGLVEPGTASKLLSIARCHRPSFEPPPRFPTDPEVCQMVETGNSMRPVLARTVAFSGLWPSELCLLTWNDVDFAAGCIRTQPLES